MSESKHWIYAIVSNEVQDHTMMSKRNIITSILCRAGENRRTLETKIKEIDFFHGKFLSIFKFLRWTVQSNNALVDEICF